MSLGPQWCLGVLLGLLLPGQAPRARPGAFGTDLGSPLGAGRRRRAAGEVARRILPMQDSGTFAALAAAKTLAASIRESVALRTLRIVAEPRKKPLGGSLLTTASTRLAWAA